MEKMKKRLMMWILMFGISVFGSYYLDLYFSLTYLESLSLYLRIFGLVLIIISSLLLRASGKALKHFGMTSKKGFGETDTLVTTGIYGCMRHPHHTGIALFVLGVGFLISSFSFLTIFVPLFWFAIYLFVKRVEEPEAIKKFGEKYIEYSKKVPGFIPRINCFMKKENTTQ